MSEMLGNQYFLSRNFDKALQQLEKVLHVEPDNEKVKKKMIICYCEVGDVPAALKLFNQVIHENIGLIADTDLVSEDCPCPELLERMKWYEKVANSSFDYHCIMGILNLYCNIQDSISYLSKAASLRPEHSLLKSIIKKIDDYARKRAKS